MLKEFSFGAIIYRINPDKEVEFLLVFSQRNERWGFPKGHSEPGESEKETAKREIFEETGINDVQFIKGFRQEDIYIIDGTLPDTKGRIVEKHSVYFLAYTYENAVIYDKDEISDIKWMTYEEALKNLSFDNQKKILDEAYKKIKDQEEKNGKSTFKG